MSSDTTDGAAGAGHESVPAFDVGGYLRRARRIVDASQRELAVLAEVDQSSLARWESGSREVTVSTLVRLLGVAGLHLEVVDEVGRRVPPFEPDTVRDNAGRRFPAHLDVLPPDQRPSNRGYGERYDRPRARGWYALRATRDAGPAGAGRPADHPTVAELTARRGRHREELRRRAAERVARRPPPSPPPRCTCFDDCYEHPACPPECPCQCEPVHGGLRLARPIE